MWFPGNPFSGRGIMRFSTDSRKWPRRLMRFSANSRAWAGLLLGVLLLAGAPALAIDIHEQTLTRARWPQHANGYNVAALSVVNQTLRRFEENGKINIVIYYPGGDPGKQWATELYGWLVSFGVPTRYLELQLGSGAADRLMVRIIDRS